MESNYWFWWVWFFVGMFTGVCLGVSTVCLLIISSRQPQMPTFWEQDT